MMNASKNTFCRNFFFRRTAATRQFSGRLRFRSENREVEGHESLQLPKNGDRDCLHSPLTTESKWGFIGLRCSMFRFTFMHKILTLHKRDPLLNHIYLMTPLNIIFCFNRIITQN